MKILMVSYAFAPQIGGIESVGLLFAQRWAEAGHEVIVVTATQADREEPHRPYIVVRQPTLWKLWRLLRWADIFFQNNLSLRFFWPWLLCPKPFFLTHHIWIGSVHTNIPGVLVVKQAVSRLATNIAISSAIAKRLQTSSTVVGSPYDEDRFGCLLGNSEARPKDFLFVGRLVAAKGVDVFLRALANLRDCGRVFTATVAGDGPARQATEALARELHIADRVEFKGTVRDQTLVETYKAHRVLIVPSRWEEPFGVVALEGLASGCQVVVTNVGGLPEAAGPTGCLFPRDDWLALAEILKFQPAQLSTKMQASVQRHLLKHSSKAVANLYSELFKTRVNVRASRSATAPML